MIGTQLLSREFAYLVINLCVLRVLCGQDLNGCFMTKLHYFTFGEGEIPIVLVHGWAASGRMWESIHPHFKNAKFFALEFMGCGRTACPEKSPTIDEHVASLIEFCEEHQPQVIIAHS